MNEVFYSDRGSLNEAGEIQGPSLSLLKCSSARGKMSFFLKMPAL